MPTYRSIAVWPQNVGIRLGNSANESSDTHLSREAAEAVCRRLEREGFGSDRKVFPVSTRVEEVPDTSRELVARRIACSEAYGAISRIAESLPTDSDERRRFYAVRIALNAAWEALPQGWR